MTVEKQAHLRRRARRWGLDFDDAEVQAAIWIPGIAINSSQKAYRSTHLVVLGGNATL